jgi:hypothetical protein
LALFCLALTVHFGQWIEDAKQRGRRDALQRLDRQQVRVRLAPDEFDEARAQCQLG